MDEPMKRRLIGLITLISLAIIFLPMIFDGSGRDSLPDIHFDAPPKLIFDQHFEGLPAGGEAGVQQLREEIDLQKLSADWVVQTGVFTDELSAENQVAELLRHGHSARYVSDAGQFVVIVGVQQSQKDAQELARVIEEKLQMTTEVKRESMVP